MPADRSLLARLELRKALVELVRRFPRLTSAGAQERARRFVEALEQPDAGTDDHQHDTSDHT
jgi:hypothetical protein